MTGPPLHMHDHFVAVRAATDLRSHALSLRRRWEASFESGMPGGVRGVVAESWTRMIGSGLEPGRLRPVRALDEEGVALARESSPLRLALPGLRSCLGGLAEDAEHIMVVSDALGRLLWIDGHGSVLEQAAGIDFVEGMDWTEGSAGTNAIGTALAIDHAVQIFSAEHFLPEQHPWWCSAAPIHDPLTGALLGIVNLSGPRETAHPHSLALVMAAAAIAEETLRVRAPRASRAPTAVAGHGGRLGLLPLPHPTWVGPGRPPVQLSLRQAEVLTLLAVHTGGLSAERLTLHLYGDDGNAVSTRALVSRLRDVVGDAVLTRPYRLAPGVTVDVQVLQELLASGQGALALAMYPGPLLEASQVEGVVALRHEIDQSVRRVALAGDPDRVWRWLQTSSGREDLDAVERFLAHARPEDPRAAVARERRRHLLATWDT